VEIMHLKRWLTSLVALPVVFFIVYQGGLAFLALMCLVALISLWEYFGIIARADTASHPVMTGLGMITAVCMILSAHTSKLDLCLGALALNLIAVGILSLSQYKNNADILDTVRYQLQGLVYIPLLLSFLVLIRLHPDGMRWIFAILAIVFAGDIGAFYVGSYLGRHKLCPAVSPGKTVEGAVGGLAANAIIGSLLKWLFFSHLAWGASLVFFVAIGIVGQIGDLFESELKRSSSIKDSGTILPGHGGMLDRIDALLFVAPVAYLFIRYIF